MGVKCGGHVERVEKFVQMEVMGCGSWLREENTYVPSMYELKSVVNSFVVG